jgi:hypothetical protein
MVSKNQINIDRLNTTKALDMLNETVNEINSYTLVHKYFGWNKFYVTLTLISAAFWALILAYGIFKMITRKSNSKLRAYIKPRNRPEHLELKNLDLERSEAQSPQISRTPSPQINRTSSLPDLTTPMPALTNFPSITDTTNNLKRRKGDANKTIADTSASSGSE